MTLIGTDSKSEKIFRVNEKQRKRIIHNIAQIYEL